jgi:hypothetical protein
MGQRVLLSSIPVHREQNPEGARYFDPDDPLALAELMAESWMDGRTGVSEEQSGRASLDLRERTIAYGRAYAALITALDAGTLEKRIYMSADDLKP